MGLSLGPGGWPVTPPPAAAVRSHMAQTLGASDIGSAAPEMHFALCRTVGAPPAKPICSFYLETKVNLKTLPPPLGAIVA